MSRFFYCLILSCFFQNAFSQADSLKFPLQVLVRDSVDKNMLNGASIQIWKNGTNVEFVLRGITNNNGVFSTILNTDSKYSITVSYQGYLTKIFKIDKNFKELNVELLRGFNTLQKVVISKKRSLVQDFGDKLVFDAEKDITEGGNAIDVLRKVPLVSVDINGNPSIKSNSNIKILVNGRPSASQNSALILKIIPSNQVKKIEIITSPSAKYEAEGTGGIINIITQNKFLLGINGTANIGVGSKGSHSFGSIYYNNDKLDVNLSYGSQWSYNKTNELISFSKDALGLTERIFNQDSKGKYNGNGTYAQVNTNYSITDNDLIGIDIMYFLHRTTLVTNSLASYLNNGILINRNTNSDDRANIKTFSTYFDHKFNNQKKKISARFTYGINRNNDSYDYEQSQLLVPVLNQGFMSNSQNREFDSQVDYETPSLQNKNMLQIGGRYISRAMSSNSRNITQNVNSTDPNIDGLVYDQSVLALYLNNSYKLTSSLAFRAGVRFESVNNSLIRIKQAYKNDYNNFFPSGGITWKPNSTNIFSLNYSYRIKRPSIQYLNPAVNTSEVLVKYIGNPYLNPEYTHNFEISYSTYINDSYIKITPYFTTTNNNISALSTLSDNEILTSYNNIGNLNIKGLNIWGSLDLIKGLTIYNSVDFIYKKIRNNNLNLENSGMMISETFNVSYAINDKLMIQYFGNYYSQRVEIQGNQSSYSFSNLSLKYDLHQKKYSFMLGIDNPFRKSFNYKIKSEIPQDLSYSSITKYYDRGIRLGFTYNFGKNSNPKIIKREKDVDDVKKREDKISVN